MLIQYPVSCLDAVSIQYAYCVMMWYQCLHKSIVQIHFSVQVQLARTHLAVIRIHLNSLAGGPEDGLGRNCRWSVHGSHWRDMVPAVPNQALGSGFPFSQCVRPTSAKHGSSCVDAPGQGSMIQLLARLIHDRPPRAGDSAACMFHHQTPLPLAAYAPKLAD